jgi:hypothetical protein
MVKNPSGMSRLGVPYSPIVPSFTRCAWGQASRMANRMTRAAGPCPASSPGTASARQAAFRESRPDVAIVGADVLHEGRRLGGPRDTTRIRWQALLVHMTVRDDSNPRMLSTETTTAVDLLRYLLAAGPRPSGFRAEQVPALLATLLATFRNRYLGGTVAPALERWIGRDLFERALEHGRSAPDVPWRVNQMLAVDPRAVKALVRHLILADR